MKPITTWILVADGARARIFVNEGPGRGITELAEYSSDKAKLRTRDINADRPGRTFDAAGHGRHAMEPPTDPQRHAKRAFAAMLADELKASLGKHVFDRLVVVAAPVTLGDLRKEFDKEVLDRVHGEIDKDLTKARRDEIAKQLEAVLAI